MAALKDPRSNETLKLSTFNDIFDSPTAEEAGTLRKLKSLPKADQNELVLKLQKQRLHINENAIHFVAEAREQSRADARNSVFKIANRFKVMPDKETVLKIKTVMGNVGGVDEDSGDEDWEPSFRKLPESLKKASTDKLMQRMQQKGKEALLDEMDNLERESQNFEGVVTKEHIDVAPNEASLITQLDKMKLQPPKEADEDHDEDDDDDVTFNDDDFQRLNTLQKEFMGNNLEQWYADIAAAYSSGVKVVKVNALGYKFIRTVKVRDLYLCITQPHTKSSVNTDRRVSLFEIRSVDLGKDSKEFGALKEYVKKRIEDDFTDPQATQCAVVRLPGNRCLSLVFLEEEQRNGFVFFLRVAIKRARAAKADVERES